MKKSLRAALLATTALAFFAAAPARAADSTADTLKALQAQINALQKQIADMQAKEKARTEAEAETAKKAAMAPAVVAAAAAPSVATAPVAAGTASAEPAPSGEKGDGKEILPGVKFKFGGYVEASGIYRSKNQTSDTSTSLNTGLPWNNSPNAHADEFRGSARTSRLSLAAEGDADKDTKLKAYIETDFLGAGPGSNSVQTNSYEPRLRQGYAEIDRSDWGSHFIAGQAFSLATLSKSGLTPGKEATPIGIDSAYVAGFVYTRSPGVRFVQDFADNKAHFAFSAESPQVNFGGITPPATVMATNTGASSLNSTANYSTDFAPDVIAKLAYDSSYGHYEMFGLTRFFRDVVRANFHNNYAMGYGGGVGAYVPVVEKTVDLQTAFLGGKGVGRYTSGQLPDFAFSSTGAIKPLTELTAMFGVIGHATPRLDLFTFVGGEKVMREDTYDSASETGYGNSNANLANCLVANATCKAQAQYIWSVTPGFWVTAYKGNYGSVKVGGQYEYIRRQAFTGANNLDPHGTENVGILSFRYSPF